MNSFGIRGLMIALPLCLATSALAGGLDRDSLLTDAPATPDKGTIRVGAGGNAATKTADGATGTTGEVNASIMWSPIQYVAGDVGGYFGSSDRNGPAARIRYQILTQANTGVDLAGGVRFKTVGFHPDNGEVEVFLATGRSFGQFDLMLNGVVGFETGGGQGKDIEIKAFAGYRFTDSVRAGLDFRLQAEMDDEEEANKPANAGRDSDLRSGPTVSWMITEKVQVQGLVGVAAPKGTNNVAPLGAVFLSFDF
ncbi:MAG: hypothetical protein JST92_12095 [Deltaproteobacteria bacterium]|nr:hypothetical protein [Deltaproteobacteria bacterium]